MSRNLFPDKLENEISSLIDKIDITLKNQFKHWSKFGIVDNGYPNFKALSTGFKKLKVIHIEDNKWIFHYMKEYVGMINTTSLKDDTVMIVMATTKEFNNGKHLHYYKTISLHDFMNSIYDISDEQLYALERVLFEFEI